MRAGIGTQPQSARFRSKKRLSHASPGQRSRPAPSSPKSHSTAIATAGAIPSPFSTEFNLKTIYFFKNEFGWGIRVTDKVLITIYDVKQCGYYKHGGKQPEFGSLSNLIAQLRTWSAGKLLGDTKLIQPDGGDDLPVYLFEIDEKDGCALVTTWNEIPATNDNKVASVAANDKVGKATMHLNDVKAGTIPGFPTFFWLLPNRDLLATLRILVSYPGCLDAVASLDGGVDVGSGRHDQVAGRS